MNDSTLPHWHILGAGSIGCLWAARLTQAGHRVTLLLRDEVALQRFQGNGSRILLMDGNDQQRLKLEATVADTVGTINHLIVATKAHQAAAAVQSITAKLAEEADVLLLQNGMGIQQHLNDVLAKQKVWVGVSTEGAFSPEYFTVVHAGHGTTRIGSLRPEANLQPLLDALRCSLTMQADADIETALWQKLLANCAINPLTAIYRCRNGELLTTAECREHLHAVCAELMTLANAIGRADLATGLVERVEHMANVTAKNRSSMLVDIEERRETEIELITGYICRLAAQHHVDVPINTALLEQINTLSTVNPDNRRS